MNKTINFSFDRNILEAMQESENFKCVFSASSGNGVAEIYEMGNAFFIRENGSNSESSESGMGVTQDEDEVKSWARQQVSHLSYNYECEGDFEDFEEMPNALLPDFTVTADEDFLSASEVDAATVNASLTA